MTWRLTRILAFVAPLAMTSVGCNDDGSGTTDPPSPTGTLSGTVLAAADNAPIVGATVTTVPSTETITTDATGAFTFGDLPIGSYEVQVAAEGFEAPTAESVTVIDGGKHLVDFSLVAIVVYASTCQECHLQEGLLLASLADDPLPDATNEGGSAGEG